MICINSLPIPIIRKIQECSVKEKNPYFVKETPLYLLNFGLMLSGPFQTAKYMYYCLNKYEKVYQFVILTKFHVKNSERLIFFCPCAWLEYFIKF